MAWRRRARARRGSTIVEMAVALPVFLLLVFGVFTIGSIYNHQLMLNTAARDGARLACVDFDQATVLRQIYAITPNLNHDPSRFRVGLTRTSTSVVCTLEYVEKVGLPVLSILFNNKVITARAEHKFETEFIAR